MHLVPQSTAVTIPAGPFLAKTDGSELTSLTIAQADIQLSKNGGALAQSNNAAGATHDAMAYYSVPLDDTDTDTLGRVRVAIHAEGAVPVWEDVLVVPQAVYAALVEGTANLNVALAATGMNQVPGEGSNNLWQLIVLACSMLLGVLEGAKTTNPTFKGAGVDTVRVSVTADGDGNRTAMVLTPPDPPS